MAPEALEGDGDEKGDRDGDDEVIAGLQVRVVGEEGGIANGPEQQRRDEGVAEEAGIEDENDAGSDERERVEEAAYP